LPSGDQGGSYEVAGINDRYHPEAFKRISALPPQERAKAAAEYIQGYTAPLVEKLPQAIQPFTQDLAFNRGLGGATKYIQQGLNALGQNVAVDGGMGPKTLQAINQVEPRSLMREASKAQLDDEYRRASENPERKKFIGGLENRIRNRLAIFGQG
jgi:lysozyme family protein